MKLIEGKDYCQEGYDIIIERGSEPVEYVEVKSTKNPGVVNAITSKSQLRNAVKLGKRFRYLLISGAMSDSASARSYRLTEVV